MGEFLFAIKTLVLTAIIVLVLQFKVGNLSLENHFYSWIKYSYIGQSIQASATGALLALQNGVATAEKKAKDLWGETPKHRSSEKATK